MKKLLSATLATLLIFPAIAQTPMAEKDIVDTAVAAGNFTTLVKLVGAAGLVDTLKSAGPFTVLAPTDAAFAKLPKALVEKLMGDKDLLVKVLTYHVIPGKILSTDLRTMKAKSVQMEDIKVKINRRGGPTFNNANVVMADVMTSNGVIHAIDTVLLPPSVAKMLKMRG